MRNSLIILCLLAVYALQAQSNLEADVITLEVLKADQSKDRLIYYPKGTTYEVKNLEGDVLEARKAQAPTFSYYGDVELLVYPTYRPDQADQFIFKNRQVNIYNSTQAAVEVGSRYEWQESQDKPSSILDAKGRYIGAVKAKKKLSPSQANPGKYNLELRFDNGIIFNYEDGKATATLDNQALEIEHKYLISSKLGMAKLSFNPNTGKVWYIFEPVRSK